MQKPQHCRKKVNNTVATLRDWVSACALGLTGPSSAVSCWRELIFGILLMRRFSPPLNFKRNLLCLWEFENISVIYSSCLLKINFSLNAHFSSVFTKEARQGNGLNVNIYICRCIWIIIFITLIPDLCSKADLDFRWYIFIQNQSYLF